MIQKQTFETVLKNSSFEKSQENTHDTVYSLCIEIDVIYALKLNSVFKMNFVKSFLSQANNKAQ